MSFPKNSAFNPEPSSFRPPVDRRPHYGDPPRFLSSETVSVRSSAIEDWVYRINELVNRLDVSDHHHVAGSHVNAVSEELDRIREEIAVYLRG